MKNRRAYQIRIGILFLMGAGIILSRYAPGAGEWYAVNIYPRLSYLLSGFASLCPFSLCEITVLVALFYLMIYPVKAWSKKKKKQIFLHELEVLAWILVWFYWAWGMTYFRADFYSRSGCCAEPYDALRFRTFLTAYTDSLNHSYTLYPTVMNEKSLWEEDIRLTYHKIPEKYGLASVYSFQHPKKSLCNGLYSSVGVLGYIGPFFSESHVNHDLLPEQYPFIYAHELSHLLGVSNEAEANFWAYQVCVCSSDIFVRHSGYVGILPYVVYNAKQVLEQPEFQEWIKTIRPEVWRQFAKRQEYWRDRYHDWVGAVQSILYDFYLKGHRIPSGQKNYAEVIGMILSFPADAETWR